MTHPRAGKTQAMWQDHSESSTASSPVLIIPTPGLLRVVDGSGREWAKLMTADDFYWLAERCMAAARETK
jgi:hypothetical protein